MAKNDRANFGSKLGVILASAGSQSDWVIYGGFPMKQETMEALLLY